MSGQWTQPDIRDEIIDSIVLWSKKAEIKALYLADWIGITSNKYYHCKGRYMGKSMSTMELSLVIIGLKCGKGKPSWILAKKPLGRVSTLSYMVVPT